MKDRSLVLRVIGAGLLLAGVASAFMGALEIGSYYAFADGGRFHYEGSGVGSLVFLIITAQVLGYYAIGIGGIVLGYGHLTLRRWARAVMLSLLWLWVLVGLPLALAALVLLAGSKQPSLPVLLLIILPLTAVVYPVAPVLLIRFYGGRSVDSTFRRHDPSLSFLDVVPLAVRVLCLLFGGYILALHLAFLVRGVFPLFGVLLIDLPGLMAIEAFILVLAVLIWGLVRRNWWAWWASLAAFGLATLSTLVTLPHYTLRTIMVAARVPEAEMTMLRNLVFLDSEMTIPATIPLFVTLGVILIARRHFRSPRVRGARTANGTNVNS